MNALWQVPAVVLSLLSWLTAPSAGLADVAARETLRRQATQRSVASLTNLGLPLESVPVAAVTLPEPAAPPASDPAAKSAEKPAAAPPKPADPPREEAWWRAKMGDARTAVDRGQMAAEALKSRINALQSDSVNIDDPIKQARARQDLGRALDELDRVNKQLETDRRAIAALQDEARRLNVPAGWIR
jgi:hypothetical protein